MTKNLLLPKIDYEKTFSLISDCIRDYLERSGAKGYVLGISGGLDSTVTATILSKSVGKERVFGLILPERESSTEDIEDAVHVAEHLGIRYGVIDITSAVESILNQFADTYASSDKVAKGNVKARIRMVTLYYFANKNNYLVAATSDKSEYLLGYFTKWGDGSGDVYPIINLYKTQVRELAKYLGVPEKIVNKPSSPGLWPGQKASDELGLGYETLDEVLYLLVDKQMPIDDVSEQTGVPVEMVSSVWRRILSSTHKRKSLVSCPIAISST